MVVVPADLPVTNPVELTVATLVIEDPQGLVAAAVAEPVNCDVEPIQENKVPDMVGEGLIENVRSPATVVPHSLVTDNETVKVPVVE